MSEYRVDIAKSGETVSIEHIKFDNKEDAEHYAKNNSMGDDKHQYFIKKNDKGEFFTIKVYQNGEVINI